MKTSTLLYYPPELIQAIGAELDLPDVKHLRLVCRFLADSLACIVLYTLTFKISRKNMARRVDMIRTLATAESEQGQEHAACRAVREISFGLLSPEYAPNNVPTSVTEDPREGAVAEELMRKHLSAAIASLKGVRSVKLTTDRRNKPFVYHVIMDALRCLPNLRHIQIICLQDKVPLELEVLRSLETMSVSTAQSTVSQQEIIFKNVAKAITQNPALTHLDIRGIMHHGKPTANKAQSLHQFFKYYPATVPPLRLRELRLKSMLVRLDDTILPHLSHLTTLHLDDIDEPTEMSSNSFFQRFGSISARLSKDRKRYGSSLEDIWNALRIARIHLQNITITSISSSFLDYLSSYTGLVKLDVVPGGFQDGVSSDAMAARFYDGRLDSHCLSLDSLRIMARFEGLWCYGQHNAKAISRLTNLTNLGMSIRYKDLAGANGHQAPSMPDAIKHLIDMTLECMPKIQSIQVEPAMYEGARHAFCGTGPSAHIRFAYEKMLESVGNYVVPPDSKRTLLPSLTVGETVFLSERESLNSAGEDTTSGTALRQLKYVNKNAE